MDQREKKSEAAKLQLGLVGLIREAAPANWQECHERFLKAF